MSEFIADVLFWIAEKLDNAGYACDELACRIGGYYDSETEPKEFAMKAHRR